MSGLGIAREMISRVDLHNRKTFARKVLLESNIVRIPRNHNNSKQESLGHDPPSADHIFLSKQEQERSAINEDPPALPVTAECLQRKPGPTQPKVHRLLVLPQIFRQGKDPTTCRDQGPEHRPVMLAARLIPQDSAVMSSEYEDPRR